MSILLSILVTCMAVPLVIESIEQLSNVYTRGLAPALWIFLSILTTLLAWNLALA